MMSDPVLQQLYIIRAQLNLLVESLEQRVPVSEPICEHPAEKRRASHNMGEEPAFICMACGQTVQGIA